MSREILQDFVNIELVIKRFKEFTGLNSKKKIAELFGIKQNEFSNKKKTAGLFPFFIKHGIQFNMNLNWLFTGEGERIVAVHEEGSEKTEELMAAANRVLKSKTHWADSLASNIVSFERGLDSEQNVKHCEVAPGANLRSIRANDPVEKKEELLKLRTV